MQNQWKPGDRINPPFSEMRSFNTDALSVPDVYRLLIGTVIPRPIAFISSVSGSGDVNLAPFSFFNAVASNPGVVMISIARRPNGSKKDTIRNIEETGQFVVNSVNRWMVDPSIHAAGAFPYGEDEFSITGLTPIPSVRVKPPRVQESAVHMECEVYTTVEIGDGSAGSSTVVFGKVLMLHIRSDAVDERGRVKPELLEPVARLGGISYSELGNVFERAIPKVGESAGNS